jgi:hypothetical protein
MMARPWSPILLPAICAFWDATYRQKFTFVDDKISVWSPIIGRDAVQATAAARPTLGTRNRRNTVLFDGADDWLSIDDTTWPSGDAQSTMICTGHVDANAGTTITSRMMLNHGASAPTNSPRQIRFSAGGGVLRPTINRGTQSRTLVIEVRGLDQVISGQWCNGAKVGQYFANGRLIGTAAQPLGTVAASSCFGAAAGGGSNYHYGGIHSALVTRSLLSRHEVEKYEGWAIHNFRMDFGAIAASHPYRTTQPMATAREIEQFLDTARDINWRNELDMERAVRSYTPTRKLMCAA